jgi:hypothetical protein
MGTCCQMSGEIFTEKKQRNCGDRISARQGNGTINYNVAWGLRNGAASETYESLVVFILKTRQKPWFTTILGYIYNIHIYIYIYIHIHINIYTYIHIYIYTYIHIYIYTYIHIYIFTYIHI